MNNWLGTLICILYVFSIIGLAEFLRRWQGYSTNFTRKIIHIGVGTMSWFIHFLFDSPWYFIGACAVFTVITYLDWRYQFFQSMQSSDPSNMGTVYFPIAAGVVVYLLWQQPPLMVAALMPLTWGDGLAPVIGRAYGKRTYSVHTSTRTLEGSLGFFLACFLFTWLALWIVPGQPMISPLTAVLPAFVVTTATTLVEAVSIWGIDNLTITAVAILILSFWPF